jgi:periplasmic divalent cation tolerance protein
MLRACTYNRRIGINDMTLPKPPLPQAQPVDLPFARPERVMIALSTAPDHEHASRIARLLVEESLAACVNLMTPIESVYRWEGRIEAAREVGMIIKTTRSRLPALERRLKALHPYQLPELIAWEAPAGSAPFIDWVIAQTRARPVGLGPED